MSGRALHDDGQMINSNVINHKRALELNSFSTNMAIAGELRCSAIESVLEDIDSAFILKEEQRNAIKAFVDGKYVLAVLTTGFGKSLIYQVYPSEERRGICFPGSFKTRPVFTAQRRVIRLIF